MSPHLGKQNRMIKENSTAYFGISKSNRVNFDAEIELIRKCLQQYEIQLEVFVDKYKFSSHQEIEMMETAFNEIDNCDFLIVELTKKAIGVGVEVGYAKAKNKPIIYIKKQSSKHSTTVGGTADYIMEYKNKNHLQKQFYGLMESLLKK